MLGRPWFFYGSVQHDGYENIYTLMHDWRKKIFHSIKEILQSLNLVDLKPKESSNTSIKKQLEITRRKKLAMMNLECKT